MGATSMSCATQFSELHSFLGSCWQEWRGSCCMANLVIETLWDRGLFLPEEFDCFRCLANGTSLEGLFFCEHASSGEFRCKSTVSPAHDRVQAVLSDSSLEKAADVVWLWVHCKLGSVFDNPCLMWLS